MTVSMPYDAVHVNHIHFDFESKRWQWGGGYPETMSLLSDIQQDLLATFIRRLYTELEIAWETTTRQQSDMDSDDDDEQFRSFNMTHEQVALRVQQNCKMHDPRFGYHDWDQIGEGASGIVYRAKDRHGSIVAIKRIRLQQHPRHDLLLNEIMVAKTPGCHVNIIQHIESYLWRDCVWIVMEYMDGGNLTDIVTNRTMFECEMATFCREILQGLVHLHLNRIVHRDIKSDNILINRHGQIKLSDFGFCARLDRHRQQRNTIAGTPCWMAPEIVANEPYGCKVDIWSFGVTVIEMIERQPPHFDNPERAATMLKLKRPPSLQHPERLTPALRHFLYRCFEVEPQLRASAKELLHHSFLDSAGPIDALLSVLDVPLDLSLLQ
ncbi:kinase-like domain-containing protein [Chlamydoabsidia padenii]|nr:kinase-like domain-containing protein [Chlamydoabsidia padenii]